MVLLCWGYGHAARLWVGVRCCTSICNAAQIKLLSASSKVHSMAGLTMPFPEDLSPFFNPAEFGSNATLAGVAVAGIFDAAYQMADVGTGMASTAPVYTLATSAVPASPVGTTLVVNAVIYTVAAHEPDGTGVSRLLLERV